MIEYTYPVSTKDQKSIWICRYGIADIHDSWESGRSFRIHWCQGLPNQHVRIEIKLIMQKRIGLRRPSDRVVSVARHRLQRV